MPRISPFALLMRPEQHTLAIGFSCASQEEFPSLIAASFQRLAAYMDELGELMTDNPYVAYSRETDGGFGVEVGFTVVRPLPGRGEIVAGSNPQGKEVMCMFLGPYQEMAPVYEEMKKWIAGKGLQEKGPVYEYYYNGPDMFPEMYLTRVMIPVF